MFWEHEGWQAVRKGNWKAVKDLKSNFWDLYNLTDDRSEEKNLATVYPDILRELTSKWDEWAAKDQVLPKHNGRYKEY